MFQYFSRQEFACKETGQNDIDTAFVLELDKLRAICGFPFHITSGYRSPEHSVEAAKERPGMHTRGIAADIRVVGGEQRYKLVMYAIDQGFTGIGVAYDFVHVDRRPGPRVMWVY